MLRIDYASTPGQTLAVSVRKIIQATRLNGDWWNDTTGAFQVGQPAFADVIQLTEGTGVNAGLYTGFSSAALSTYTGPLRRTIHTTTQTLDSVMVFAANGIEIDAVTSPPATIIVAEERTWRIDEGSSLAPNILTEPAGVSATLAMDFSAVLNPGTQLSSITSVIDTSAEALVPTNPRISQDALHAYFDVTGLVDEKTYKLQVTVTTSDGNTLVRTGTLRAD